MGVPDHSPICLEVEKMVILEEETYNRFGYYPSDLTQCSGKPILAACDDCGKIRKTAKHDYRAFCPSCVSKGNRHSNYGKHLSKETRKKISNSNKNKKGEKSSNWKGGLVKRKCKECGKEFETKPSRVERGGGLFCSRACVRVYLSKKMTGSHNPSWKGGLIERKCQECGKKFFVIPSRIKGGKEIYCSRSCARRVQRHTARPQKTYPELIFEEICAKYNLPFKFVGDGSLWLGNVNPDFIHKTRKLVVEIFGDYWHSPLLNSNLRYTQTLEGRKKQLKVKGYKLIVFWESDLKRKDVEKFLLNALQKEKIIKKVI